LKKTLDKYCEISHIVVALGTACLTVGDRLLKYPEISPLGMKNDEPGICRVPNQGKKHASTPVKSSSSEK
jgi:hypothetical protein